MFDPLGTSPFANDNDNDSTPPWPTTPYSPNSQIPNLRKSTSRPQTPDTSHSAGPYGKEPQIYGQPEQGLISPPANGVKHEKPQPYLRVRIVGLDRNRRDILIRFDAQTNLPNFTGQTYRNISRSYVEFQQFYEAIIYSNPQTIVPALPLAQTSAPTDEEDDRLVKIMLQRWLTRVCEDPFLMRDEELRSFIESDFGYQPTPRPRRKTSSGFSLIRKGVPDEDEELQKARFELTKLEGQFFETAKALDKVSRARKNLSIGHAEMGNKLISVATTEAHPPLANALRKLGRTLHSVSDLDQAQAISESVIIGDTTGYQGLNARSAKETLLMRTQVLEEYQSAVKTTISKRRQIERLKASSNIRPDKVDEALEDMEEANKYEQILAQRVDGISQNLHRALQRHDKLVHDDVTAALIEHTRSTIMYERQLLRELEALRPDLSSADKKIVHPANSTPKPKIILPLEDDFKPPPPVPESPAVRTPSPLPPLPPTPATATIHGPPSRSVPAPMAPQSPGAGPSTPTSPTPASSLARPPLLPPLGGRFTDGTRSMFIQPTSSPLATGVSSAPPAPSGLPAHVVNDPLGPLSPNATSTFRHQVSSPLGPGGVVGATSAGQGGNVDPLGAAKPNYMSQSMRVTPTRPRLDAREAASKLANFF
ncbi:hypothetical protein BD410DRAFT_779573 [Rickenella mellea]|uniref:PX domain-containing protein n=1 Tax=Rickenella mellea TaxID=50990 RepID=A0A4V3AZI4_9AGAM|nr:hypothetical protein BD410DRAFT_779573 [Rickenella mellea]